MANCDHHNLIHDAANKAWKIMQDIIDRQAEQIKAKDELIRWVWLKSITLFEAKDRCERALKGGVQ